MKVGFTSVFFSFCLIISNGLGKSELSFIQASLFPNIIPPYIHFQPIFNRQTIVQKIKRDLIWPAGFGSLRAPLHDATIRATGLTLLKEEESKCTRQNGNLKRILGWLIKPKNCKINFSTLPSHQKIKFIQGIHELGDKARLSINLQEIQRNNPFKKFKFLLPSFVLPNQMDEFKKTWTEEEGKIWISKLPMTSQSEGIQIIRHWTDVISRQETHMIQKYIEDPYLYKGRKVEIRYPFLITSIYPLRVYALSANLWARSGPTNYTQDPKLMSDLCIHAQCLDARWKKSSQFLNRNKNEDFISNFENEERDSHRNDILRELHQKNPVSIQNIISAMNDAIVISLLSAQPKMLQKQVKSQYSTFHFLNGDFVLNSNLEPKLMEINSFPVATMRNPNLRLLNGDLYSEMLNVAGFHFPPWISKEGQMWIRNSTFPPIHPNSSVTFSEEFYKIKLTEEDKVKRRKFKEDVDKNRSSYLDSILNNLTRNEVKQLMISEDENFRAVTSKRIFPSPSMFKNYGGIQPYNSSHYFKLLDAWESKYEHRRADGRNLLRKLYSNI